jgi:hypothetical protein
MRMHDRSPGAPKPQPARQSFRPGFNPFTRAGSALEPNFFSLRERLTNTFLSAALLAYGTFGIYIDDLYIPGKRGRGLHFHGTSAWLMYAALVCAAAVLFALVVDHYDRRHNEHHYERFKKIATTAGWSFFGAACVWHLAGLFRR